VVAPFGQIQTEPAEGAPATSSSVDIDAETDEAAFADHGQRTIPIAQLQPSVRAQCVEDGNAKNPRQVVVTGPRKPQPVGCQTLPKAANWRGRTNQSKRLKRFSDWRARQGEVTMPTIDLDPDESTRQQSA